MLDFGCFLLKRVCESAFFLFFCKSYVFVASEHLHSLFFRVNVNNNSTAGGRQ